MKNASAKTEVSQTDRLKLIGLLTLARHHTIMLEDIERAAREITAELDENGEPLTGLGGGHTGDAVYGYGEFDADELLRRLDLKVTD